MPLDSGTFYLLRASNGWSLLLRRGLSAPKIVTGGARYSVIERPRRKSVVQWAGDDPWKMDVPVIFDGFIQGKSVELDIRRTEQMCQSRGDLTAPYTFRLDGALPVSGGLWVMESIDWGDNVYWYADNRGSGHRVRQDATLHCLQYETEEILQINKPPPVSKPWRVVSGQTLAFIAAQTGVPQATLRKYNNMRDGKQLKVGTTIMIPPQTGKN